MEKKKRNLKKIGGATLIAVGMITYTIYYIWQYFVEKVPQIVFNISTFIFIGGVGLGLILILFKKDVELDDDLQKSMDEKRSMK